LDVLEQSELLFEYREKKDPELQERYENQNEFVNGVKMFENFNPDAGIADFMQEVSLQSDIDSWEDSDDAVTMMTIHSAKGLEFKHVFIAGMEEGLFPLERTRLDPKEMEEERRLFYVAITRAMENLTITSSLSRMRYGTIMGTTPSQFILEIPDKYIDRQLMRGARKMEMPKSTRSDFSSFKRQPASSPRREVRQKNETIITPLRAPKPGSIGVGDRVAHKMFGKGRVRSIIRSSQTLLKIEFDSGVNKTIAEKFVEKV
jgi:DNA helicase-2/ATP-dependent DNA helicase PcrA